MTNPTEKAKELEEAAIVYQNNTYADPPFTARAFIAGAQWQSQQPDIKQWVSENADQAFEHFANLSEQLQYAACNWKVDMSTWSELLQEINKVCEIALSK